MTVRVFGSSLLPASARRPGAIAAACRRTLRSERADRKGELNVVIVDRRRMLALNRRFLRHDHDTDVIAFPYEEPGTAARGGPFGDVYVSAYQARRQARELGHPVLREVLTLVVHGTLHLLGYDDGTPAGRARMFRRQDRILSDGEPRS